ncbi:MAG: hypothetical protein KME19_25840 [Microcoleus vaginatus WJT46-NPBG5]|nr:hypothetical protein [Microcoleus vaginatus WJT46-NPBG5]
MDLFTVGFCGDIPALNFESGITAAAGNGRVGAEVIRHDTGLDELMVNRSGVVAAKTTDAFKNFIRVCVNRLLGVDSLSESAAVAFPLAGANQATGSPIYCV